MDNLSIKSTLPSLESGSFAEDKGMWGVWGGVKEGKSEGVKECRHEVASRRVGVGAGFPRPEGMGQIFRYYLLLPVRPFEIELGKMQNEIIRVLAFDLDCERN